MDPQIEVKKIVEGINVLHSSISSQNWGNASRAVFVAALEKAIGGLNDLRGGFERLNKELERGSSAGKPGLSELMKEFDALMPVLKNNLKMEREKKSRAKESNIFEKEETAELYSELAQRIQTLLLRARYMAERFNVFVLRQSAMPLKGESTAKQMLDLLQAKEKEIQDLRERYGEIRKQSFLGYAQEQTSVDLEEELNGLAMRMGSIAAELGKEIEMHRSQLEFFQNSNAELKNRLDSAEEIFNDYVGKSLELIAMLKKERDYAKKVVLDVEHETLQLRNAYTSEMLSLQENKLGAKKEAEDKAKKEIDALKKELKEREELLGSFRRIAEDKAEKENALEEKVKKLTLLLKTKEKHEAVKRHLRKAEKKKRKR